MELIENYQPEYVKRFKENNDKCLCQTCQKEGNGFPFVTLRWKNQQRESLSLSCQTAAKEILLNPQAFVLHMSSIAVDSKVLSELEHDIEMLHQMIINHVIDNRTNYKESLYAISILLNKMQRGMVAGALNTDELVALSTQLSDLISSGELDKHFSEIPKLPNICQSLLIGVGDIKLELDLPLVRKMSFMLKLSELKILSEERLAERLIELEGVLVSQQQFLSNVDFIFKNFILYKIYHNTFFEMGEGAISGFKGLCDELFEIKILLSLYLLDTPDMALEEFSIIISSYYKWKKDNSSKRVNSVKNEDAILYGLAVL